MGPRLTSSGPIPQAWTKDWSPSWRIRQRQIRGWYYVRLGYWSHLGCFLGGTWLGRSLRAFDGPSWQRSTLPRPIYIKKKQLLNMSWYNLTVENTDKNESLLPWGQRVRSSCIWRDQGRMAGRLSQHSAPSEGSRWPEIVNTFSLKFSQWTLRLEANYIMNMVNGTELDPENIFINFECKASIYSFNSKA